MAAFKVPKTIRIVPQIPRTPTGKLQRRRVAGLLDEADDEVRRRRRRGDRRLRRRGTGARRKRVTLIARGAHLRAMQEHGVRVLSPRGDFHVHPPATDDLGAVVDADVALIGLKAYSLPSSPPASARRSRVGRR